MPEGVITIYGFELVELLVHALKFLVLIIGGIITYYSYRAYVLQKDRSLLHLTLGFGFITVGAIIGGIVIILTNRNFLIALLFDSIFMLVGLAFILYSLHVTTTETQYLSMDTNIEFISSSTSEAQVSKEPSMEKSNTQ